MLQAVIISAVRTPVGRYGGALAAMRPDDLAALVIREAVARAKIEAALVDDVYLGAANQAGEDNRNVARMAALLAGLPDSVPGATINRLCASGLEAVNVAARMIEAGMGEVFVAGGVESMSRAPFVMAKAAEPFDRKVEVYDTTIGWRFTNPKLAALHHPFSMGETAENVARQYHVSRQDQDRFAFASQMKCKAAMEAGRFDDEIVPVEIPQRKGEPVIVARDEHPRPETTPAALARLKPAFVKPGEEGTVTAGNSSGINDGAAALVIVEAGVAARLGVTPMAVIGPSATAGVDPACMGIGPVPATAKALHRAGLTLADIDIIELNEAFAAQSLACLRAWGLDDSCWDADEDGRPLCDGRCGCRRSGSADAGEVEARPGMPPERSGSGEEALPHGRGSAQEALPYGRGSAQDALPYGRGSAQSPIVNPNGGAIALGHPLGCSGARLMVTLVHELRRRGARRGLATLCVGVGQGVATIVELP